MTWSCVAPLFRDNAKERNAGGVGGGATLYDSKDIDENSRMIANE